MAPRVAPVGVKVEEVSDWLATHVEGASAPFTFELIAGGRSNLTYRVTGADGTSMALRRPPTGHVLPTAHDMVREHTILSALGRAGSPVPRVRALCTDTTVNDAPFYVMDFIEGHILRNAALVEETFPLEIRATVGPHLARTLAELHLIDVDEAGLGDLARREGYIERQLRRWTTQFDAMAGPEAPQGEVVRRVGTQLASQVPPQQAATVVHGDYRLDNCVLDGEGRVRAILDWELCTLGDPLADLGLLLVYWAEPDDEMTALLDQAPTLAPGFGTRAELIEAYGSASTLDLASLSFYVAFGYWRLACILQGVVTRYEAGAGAGDNSSVAEYADHVRRLAELAATTLEGARR